MARTTSSVNTPNLTGNPTVRQAKEKALSYIQQGMRVRDAMGAVNRTEKLYEWWKKTDPEFKRRVAMVRAKRGHTVTENRDELAGDFSDFRRRFLQTETFWHQLQWLDLLEGKEPRDLHPAQRYEPGDKNFVLVNTAPEHAKALSIDTPVLTPNGWKTIGSIRVGDEVFGPDGKPTVVTIKSRVFEKPCYRVKINDGESFIASDDHIWTVCPDSRHPENTIDLTTRELYERGSEFKLPGIDALHAEPIDYILDPYVLGAWLGDGHTSSGQFTSADIEVMNEIEQVGFEIVENRSTNTGRAKLYNISGLYPFLCELGVRGRKFIPEGYLLGSYEQRLSLLQGLLDTDGTVTVYGQVSFTNTNYTLAEGVWYLASSLGLRPTLREGRATFEGRDCGPKWTVTFTAGAKPVFRLSRKLRRLPYLNGEASGRGLRLRRIVGVEPCDTVSTQCIAVDNDSHLFLIGKSLIPTHNTMTLSIDYPTYRLCKNPNIRILLVSETQKRAKEFLYAIQQRLTHPRYSDLQMEFAPAGGFKGESTMWRQEVMYLGGEMRDSGEKDPTVQALGIGGQIYGARADLIILDDCVVLSNAHLYEDQIRWIQQEVLTRLGPTGTLVIAGTRVDPIDLYRELRNPDRYPDGVSPWTYLAQPAVMSFHEDPEKWVTLWPRSDIPWPGSHDREDGDGLFPRWDGKYLRKRRSLLDPKTWSMVYMQADVDEEAVFPPEVVRACINGNRTAGPLQVDNQYHRDGGMNGLYVVCAMDPAMAGDTATIAYAVDRQTYKRYLLDAHKMTGPTPQKIRDKIMEFTERYKPAVWSIEKNAFQLFLTKDEEIRSYLASRGIIMREHFTGSNKLDPDFGVASLASLFRERLIELPSPHNHEGAKAMIEQLVTWAAKTKNPQDLPMALWFAEIVARQVANTGIYRAKKHVPNPFLPRQYRLKQGVVNLQEWANQAA